MPHLPPIPSYTPEAAPQTGQRQRERLLLYTPTSAQRQRPQARPGAAHAQRRTSRPAPAETPPGGPAGTHSARTAATRLQIANAPPIPSTSPNGSADARRPPWTPPCWTRSTATEDGTTSHRKPPTPPRWTGGQLQPQPPRTPTEATTGTENSPGNRPSIQQKTPSIKRPSKFKKKIEITP